MATATISSWSHGQLYPEPFDNREFIRQTLRRDPERVAAPAAAALMIVLGTPVPTPGSAPEPENPRSVMLTEPMASPARIRELARGAACKTPATEVRVAKAKDGRTGVVLCEKSGTVAYLTAGLPISTSATLFFGDRVISVDGRECTSSEACRLIHDSNKASIVLGVDTRGATTETRIVDRQGKSLKIGLAACNGDPSHTLESSAAGQVLVRDVVAGSPAHLANLQPGDTILSVEGVPATNAAFTRELIMQVGALHAPRSPIICRGQKVTMPVVC